MTDKAAIRELREKVEAGDCDRTTFDWTKPNWPQSIPAGSCEGAYHGSLDDALALHEAVLPGWSWSKPAFPWKPKSVGVTSPTWQEPDEGYDEGGYPTFDGLADTPARAWLIAILKAMEEQ